MLSDTCFSLPDLLHSVWQPLGPFISLQMVVLFLFMAEYYSTAYVYHIFFSHSSVDGHLGCFHVSHANFINTEVIAVSKMISALMQTVASFQHNWISHTLQNVCFSA